MDLDKQIEKAEEALKRRNYDFAINLFLQLLQIAPNNLKARQGLFDAASRNYDRKHGGKTAKPRKGAGIGSSLSIFMRSGGRKEPSIVITACDKVIARNPHDVTALDKLGYACSRAGHLESAVFAFEKVLELHPTSVQAAKNLGRLYQRLGRIEEALDRYKKALDINPGDQESIKARKDLAAEAAIRGHGYAEAQSSMDLVKDKSRARELELVDRVVKDEASIQETIDLIQKKLQENPDDRRLLTRLGELHEQKGDLDQAQATFVKLSTLEPTNFDFKEHMGDLRLRVAEDELNRLEQEEPDSASLAEARKNLLTLKVSEYAWRTEAHPTDLPARFRFGEALLHVGRYDDAISEFQKTIQDPRKRLDSRVMMAHAFMKKGMLDMAASQLQKALDGAGEGTQRGMQIRYNLGVIYEQQGKMDEARVFFMQVYERDIQFRDVKERLESIEKKSSQG